MRNTRALCGTNATKRSIVVYFFFFFLKGHISSFLKNGESKSDSWLDFIIVIIFKFLEIHKTQPTALVFEISFLILQCAYTFFLKKSMRSQVAVCIVDSPAFSSWTAVLLQTAHLWPNICSEVCEENGACHQSHLFAKSSSQKQPWGQLLSNHHPPGTAQQEIRYFSVSVPWSQQYYSDPGNIVIIRYYYLY